MHRLHYKDETVSGGLIYCKHHGLAPVYCPGAPGQHPAAGAPVFANGTSHLLQYVPLVPTPRNTFPAEQVTLGNGRKGKRFVHYAAEQKSQCLIYTSAFHDVLQQGQGAGFAFEFRGTYEYTDAIREHLEERGPKGVLHNQSNERAHLRAILAALTWKSWEDEGWKGIVIATNCPRLPNDSSFNYWIYSDWQARVTNGDLWEAISDEITSLKGRGVAVFFWKVSDEECQFVQEAAKLGAKMRTPPYYRTLTANLPTELNV